MKKPNRRMPDLKRKFGSIEIGVWVNARSKYVVSVMFQIRALYRDARGEEKVAKSLSRDNMLDIREGLDWVDGITVDDYWVD